MRSIQYERADQSRWRNTVSSFTSDRMRRAANELAKGVVLIIVSPSIIEGSGDDATGLARGAVKAGIGGLSRSLG